MLKFFENADNLMRHANTIATIGGSLQYSTSVYRNAFTCHSALDKECFAATQKISSYVGVIAALVVATSSLASTLYYTLRHIEKPQIVTMGTSLLTRIIGFLGGHVNFLLFITGTYLQIYIKSHPDINPNEVFISNAAFLGMIAAACAITAYTHPNVRYSLRKLYLEYNHPEADVASLSRGSLAQMGDMSGASLFNYALGYGLIASQLGIITRISPHLLPINAAWKFVPPIPLAVGGLIKNYFMGPPDFIKNPPIAPFYLNCLNSFNTFIEILGTFFFMSLLYSSIFIQESNQAHLQDFKNLSILFYLFLIILSSDTTLLMVDAIRNRYTPSTESATQEAMPGNQNIPDEGSRLINGSSDPVSGWLTFFSYKKLSKNTSTQEKIITSLNFEH